MKKYNHNLYPAHHDTVTRVVETKPALARLLHSEQSLTDYLAPALGHTINPTVFPGATLLQKIIVDDIKRLHGEVVAARAAQVLDRSWVVESGAHAALPRRHDKISKIDQPQLNALVVQGQMLWATLRSQRGHAMHIALATGIIPPNNDNSGRYLDFSRTAKPIALVSNAYKETPQSFIPALTGEALAAAAQKVQSSHAAPAEKVFGRALLTAMATDGAESFVDQLLRAHKVYMAHAAPDSGEYVSADSLRIAQTFIVRQLRTSSLTRTIFDDKKLRTNFAAALAGIQTGWKAGEGMFYAKDNLAKLPRLREAENAPHNADELAALLEAEELIPKTLLRFAVLLLEGGLGFVGGMSQASYCSQLQVRLAQFVKDNFAAEKTRAAAIAALPLDRAMFTPCWGLKSISAGATTLDSLDFINEPLTAQTMDHIKNLQTHSAFAAALPSISSLLHDHRVDYPPLMQLQKLGVITRVG